MRSNPTIWLIDATTYKLAIDKTLSELKKKFYILKSIARRKRLGLHRPSGTLTYSIGLLRLANILSSTKCSVRYIPLDEVYAEIVSAEMSTLPDILAFGAICPTVPVCAKLTNIVKKRSPRTRVVIGGAQARLAPNLIRTRWPIFDDVITENDIIATKLMGVNAPSDTTWSLNTVSSKGMEWLLQNQDKLVLKMKKSKASQFLEKLDDDIPF